MLLILLLLDIALGGGLTWNCCKWGGRNICASFECCPTGGQPILDIVNGSWVCTCKHMQQCPEPPTFRPTYPPVPDWPSPPTPQPYPTTSLPSTQPPTSPRGTYRPTTRAPSTVQPTKKPTMAIVTDAQHTEQTQVSSLAIALCTIGGAAVLFCCTLFVIYMFRKHQTQRAQQDDFVVLEEHSSF